MLDCAACSRAGGIRPRCSVCLGTGQTHHFNPGDVIFVRWGAGRLSQKKQYAIVDRVSKEGRVSIRKWRVASQRITKHTFPLEHEEFLGFAPKGVEVDRARAAWFTLHGGSTP